MIDSFLERRKENWKDLKPGELRAILRWLKEVDAKLTTCQQVVLAQEGFSGKYKFLGKKKLSV